MYAPQKNSFPRHVNNVAFMVVKIDIPVLSTLYAPQKYSCTPPSFEYPTFSQSVRTNVCVC